MIRFRYASQLKDSQIEGIHALVDACIAYEGLSLTMPQLDEEDTQVFLSYAGSRIDQPLGVLIAFPGEEYFEVTAFTHPDCRCEGIFTSLFERFMAKNGETAVCFYPDGNSYDALATLDVLECEYSGTEQMMTCDLKNRPLLPIPDALSLEVCDDIPLMEGIHSRAFGLEPEDSRTFLTESLENGAVCWLIRKDNQPAGICLGTADGDNVYLYGFCIDPDLQQQGIGTGALAMLLDCLSDVYQTVTIQVTEENTAAYRLYCSAGFTSTQELMEYWY